MSLLDDVSIVVTPNGYKAGELYAVVPVPTEGSEEVTNGDFATDSDWTKTGGATISGGQANIDGDGTSYVAITQTNVFTEGIRYKVTVDAVITSGLGLKIQDGANNENIGAITTTGLYEFDFIATSNSSFVIGRRTGGTAFDSSVDNVSVKEYTAADMDVTRATAATRVDEAGLVNYAEILGSELVNCVNFDCADPAAVWNEGTGWSFSGGKAIYDGTGGTSPIAQSDVIEVGKQYKITIEVLSNEGSGSNTLFLGGTILSTGNLSVGTHTFFGSTNNTSVALTIYGRSGEVFEIGSFSAKEVTRDNVPRIDYSGGGCPHILAEPQRTNLITYSSDFSSGWTGAATLNSNSSISPDGTLNASNILRVSSSPERKDFNVTVLANTEYIYSFYIKEGSQNNGDARMAISTSVEQILYITPTSDWVRYELLIPSTNTNTSVILRIYPSNGAAGGVDGDNINIYGAQLEEGSYATSYIPTSGSTVTRVQDQFSRDGIGSLINSTEGVLFVEMAALSNDSTRRIITLTDGTLNNILKIEYKNVSNQLEVVLYDGSTQCLMIHTLSDESEFNKIAFKYKENDFSLFVNGTEVGTDSSGTTFASNTLSDLNFSQGGSNNFFGKVKQLQVYKTALTDTQLAALTS